MSDFLAAITERIVVADGAMGTMLHAAGHAFDGSVAALNLTRPAVVGTIHEAYLGGGAELIQTNTFGANRLRLAHFGLADDVHEINVAGARIAHEAARAADRPIFVAGSVSPAVSVAERSGAHRDERVSALHEQMQALVDGGVDVLLLETFGYLDELVEAVEVAHEFGLPVVAQATFAEDGLSLSGHRPEEIAKVLSELSVDVIGVNCTTGPSKLVSVVSALAGATSLPLSVQANAGRPDVVPGQYVRFAVDADYFASFVQPFVAAGAVLVGGCCGTTPAIIRAVAEQAAPLRPERVTRRAPRRATSAVRAPVSDRPRGFRERLASDEFLVVVELSPAVSRTPDEALAFVSRLRHRGVDLFLIPPESHPRAQISQLSLALALRQRTNIEPILPVTAWEKSVMALQAELLGAHALQINNIVCQTGGGGHPVGDYPSREVLWDTDALGLISLLAGLNDGRECSGRSLNTSTEFVIGARCNLGREDLEGEIARTVSKVRTGAHFLVTGPIYDAVALTQLHHALAGEQGLALLATVRPVSSAEESAYLYYEVPDANLPRATFEALHGAGDRAGETAVEFAETLLRSIRPDVRGVVLSAQREDQLDRLIDVAVELRRS